MRHDEKIELRALKSTASPQTGGLRRFHQRRNKGVPMSPSATGVLQVHLARDALIIGRATNSALFSG